MESKVEQIEQEALLLKAIAHPIRLAILEVLSQDEECVCHLSTLFDKPQPYISKQLAELREAGLVIDRRDGMRIYYSLTDHRVASMLEQLRALSGRISPSKRINIPGCPCPRCI